MNSTRKRACVARIEKRLVRLDGVSVSMNLATERATLTYTDTVTPDELVAQVEAAGCRARVPAQADSGASLRSSGKSDDATRPLRERLLISGNVFWAFACNIATIRLATAGLLSPMIAGAAVAFSSVFVVTNSLRLRRFRPLTQPANDPELRLAPARLDQTRSSEVAS